MNMGISDRYVQARPTGHSLIYSYPLGDTYVELLVENESHIHYLPWIRRIDNGPIKVSKELHVNCQSIAT